MMRADRSTPPPAGTATMILIAREGKSGVCACAGTPSASKAMTHKAERYDALTAWSPHTTVAASLARAKGKISGVYPAISGLRLLPPPGADGLDWDSLRYAAKTHRSETIMPEHFPIFVGITGKRKFSDDAEIAKQLEDGVRKRLSKTFEYIESRLPIAPKILLTGGAIGADLIAAEELLFPSSGIHRKHWLVAVILPFEEVLFQQDFNTDEWERYRRVTSDPRTLVWEL